MNPDSSPSTRSAAVRDAIAPKACLGCGHLFAPARAAQKFCSAQCRAARHRDGLTASISGVRLDARGGVVIRLYLKPVDREAAVRFTPGDLVQIAKAEGQRQP